MFETVSLFSMVLSILFAFFSVLGLIPVMMSAMLFDAPGSTRKAPAILMFIAVLGLEIFFVFGIFSFSHDELLFWLSGASLFALLPLAFFLERVALKPKK